MYALKYGTPPVATAVGGLKDSIIPWPRDNATGFTFYNADPQDLYESIMDACEIWENNPDMWRGIMLRAMNKDFTWDESAARYIELYRGLGLRD
jgi:starch synthase